MSSLKRIAAGMCAIMLAVAAVAGPFRASAQATTTDNSPAQAQETNMSWDDSVLGSGRWLGGGSLFGGRNNLVDLLVLDQLFGNNSGLFGRNNNLTDLIILDSLFNR